MTDETLEQERIIDLSIKWILVFLNLQQLTYQMQVHNNDVLVIQEQLYTLSFH